MRKESGSRTTGGTRKEAGSRTAKETWKELGSRRTEDMQALYRREDFDMPDYHLIRVEMSERLLQICQDNCVRKEDCLQDKPGGFFARRRRKKQQQQDRMLLAAFLMETLGQQNAEVTNVKTANAKAANAETANVKTANTDAAHAETANEKTAKTKAAKAELADVETAKTEAAKAEIANVKIANTGNVTAGMLHPGTVNAGKIKGVQEKSCFGSFVCQEPMPYFAERYFNDYFAADWVRHMLRYGRYVEDMTHTRGRTYDSRIKEEVSQPLAHFMILGQTACLPEILYEHVRGIKSLKWILPRRQFLEGQQELVEVLSEEYGLAAEVRLLFEEEGYRQVHPVCRVPSLVLDFSEEDRIPTADVARGSIWLDMASSEEKRRRIEDRDTGIHYFSLKKEWKQPQKALNYLDTISKNGYNT